MKYIFIGAHLDDVELAAGGLIALLVSKRHIVKMVSLSKSDYSNWKGDVLREKDVAIREGYQAAEILGCELEVLDFPTKDIPYNSTVVEAIEKILYDFEPDIIFTHNVNDTHQAHIATAQATLSAARRFNTIYFYEPIYPSGRSPIPFRPDVYVNIDGYLDKKIDSLKAHKSQFEKYSESWIEAVIARARFRGFENGMHLAECFEVCRMELKV
jgi:LmbE family N-acetylglucosaminyl deacetylase